MGTIRRLTDIQLGSIGTTKLISVTPSERLYQISSGYRAVEIGVIGTNALVFYGQSSLLANSGLFINTSGGAKFWDSVTDDFSMYLVVYTNTQQVIIQEYRGN